MPSLYLLYRLDGRTVVADALKLEIKVVKSGDELRLRRVASDNDGLFAEDFFNNKTTPVMLQSGFAEQLAKADVLLFIKPERVFITRRSGLLIGLVCRVSVHIHIWLKKGSRLGSDPGLAEREPLSDKGTARSHLAMGKIRGGESLTEVPKILHYGFRAGLFPVQYYNRFGTKKIHRYGLERTGADIETEAFYPVVYCVRNKRKRL